MFVLTTDQIIKACEYSCSAAFSFFSPAPVEMFAHNKQPRRSWELHTCWRKKESAAGKKTSCGKTEPRKNKRQSRLKSDVLYLWTRKL